MESNPNLTLERYNAEMGYVEYIKTLALIQSYNSGKVKLADKKMQSLIIKVYNVKWYLHIYTHIKMIRDFGMIQNHRRRKWGGDGGDRPPNNVVGGERLCFRPPNI